MSSLATVTCEHALESLCLSPLGCTTLRSYDHHILSLVVQLSTVLVLSPVPSPLAPPIHWIIPLIATDKDLVAPGSSPE